MSELHMTDFTNTDEVQYIDDDSSMGNTIPVRIETPTISPIPILPQLSVALCLLLFVFGITYVGTTGSQKQLAKDLDVRVETMPTPTDEHTSKQKSAFSDVDIKARGAIVWDVREQKVLFNKNADEKLPLASITKLMTALVAYELLDQNEKISITTNALHTEGDSGFVDGERFSVKNLSDLTLITSSNDGAAALSAKGGVAIDPHADPEAIFVEAMNVKAKELGLTKTRFSNSTGLDVSSTEASAYGSARDIAHLMEYVITHITDAVTLTTLDLTKISNVDGAYHTAKNTNAYVENIDGLIASKTGYTTIAGGNLVIAVNVGLNRPIIVVVLGSSFEGRFDDAITLVEHAREHITNEEVS